MGQLLRLMPRPRPSSWPSLTSPVAQLLDLSPLLSVTSLPPTVDMLLSPWKDSLRTRTRMVSLTQLPMLSQLLLPTTTLLLPQLPTTMLLLPQLLSLPQLLLQLRLLLSQLLLMLMLLLLPTMLLPQLSNMLDTKSTTRSIMFPRSLFRSTPLPTPPTMSSTTLQSLVPSLDSSLWLLLLPLLLLRLLLRPPQLLRKLKEPKISYLMIPLPVDLKFENVSVFLVCLS